MESADIAKFKALYLQTARAYVRDMQTNLAILMSGQDSPEAVNVLHLASHSLASQSLLMGYVTIGSSAFAMEKIFKAEMEEHLRFKDTSLQLFDESIKLISTSLDEIEKTGRELDLSEQTKKLQELLSL